MCPLNAMFCYSNALFVSLGDAWLVQREGFIMGGFGG
jgi:hypothetical protein